MRRSAILLLGLGLVSSSAGTSPAQDLTVSVAISMKEAVDELGRRFQRARPGVTLRFNFGSSGELEKQIEAGAPIDVFVSAAEQQMDDLAHRGLVLAGSRRTVARNALSVIVPSDSRVTLATASDLLQPHIRRIAIGNPKTVPAGRYAEECLRHLGFWDGVRGRFVFGENVRQVLEYVVRGEVDAGFVYVTDVRMRAAQVREAFRPPRESYTPVTYPAAVVAGTRYPDLGRAFVEFLASRDGQEVLSRLAFLPVTEVR